MDHLPIIEDPAYPSPVVPCLCLPNDYDGLGVFGFPERVGWKIDRVHGPVRTHEARSSIDSRGALLQPWLFFGVLYDVFQVGGMSIDLQKFKRHTDNTITTAPLKDYLDSLSKREGDQSLDICMQRQQKLRDCFHPMTNIFHVHGEGYLGPEAWKISSIFSLDLVLSILIMAETLKSAALQIWPVPFSESPVRTISFSQRQNPLERRLLHNGWCPSEVSMLTVLLDNTGLLFASMLKMPFAQNLKHDGCNHEHCLALQTDEVNYKTRHSDECDTSCTQVLIDQHRICTILKGGGIPIICLATDADFGNPKVKVMDFLSNTVDYMAVSHVWAHGIGNPKANALPSCQISRLYHLCLQRPYRFRNSLRQVAFWIDTLCIPVDSTFKEYRKLAITRLAGVFREAKRVLVLDAGLQNSSKECSRLELATRMLCAGWMKRLWTFQEAVMADTTPNCSKIDVQFSEGCLEFNSLMGNNLRSLYHTESAVNALYSSFPQFQSKDKMFGFLARALEYRTTSKIEDEALCLASILGIDTKPIANASTAEQRVRTMYILMEQVPNSILFHRSTRLDLQGFRWAPATLLGFQKWYTFWSLDKKARCDAQGLHVQFAGFVVTRHDTRPAPPIVSASYYIGDREEALPRMWVRPMDDTDVYLSTTPWSAMNDAYELDRLMRDTTKPGFIINPKDMAESVLVSVIEEKDGIIHARYLKKIYMEAKNFHRPEHAEWKDNLIEAREVSEEQSWCIS